ncbi:hypothetical protein [Enemella sp. A6]|uniref:hypothetical protein n=1 Tax=Enemella sp. A6 TaxID=3440152 RepID=UPI003EC046A3
MTTTARGRAENTPQMARLLAEPCPVHDVPVGVPCWFIGDRAGGSSGVCGARIHEAIAAPNRLAADAALVRFERDAEQVAEAHRRRKEIERQLAMTQHRHRHPNRKK